LPSNAFNSFEDETCGKIDKPSPYTPTFNSFEDETFFGDGYVNKDVKTFNSFEDETFILVAKRHCFGYTFFNSFEDETREDLVSNKNELCLSIPLRMKHQEYWRWG